MNMELYNLAKLAVDAANIYRDPYNVDPEGPYYSVADVDLRAYFDNRNDGVVEWTASLGKYSVGPQSSPTMALKRLEALYNEKIEQQQRKREQELEHLCRKSIILR